MRKILKLTDFSDTALLDDNVIDDDVVNGIDGSYYITANIMLYNIIVTI